MARRRPRQVRAAHPDPRRQRDPYRREPGVRPPHRHTPRRRTAYRRAPREIDGLPRRVQAEIDRLERTRNYLYSGSVTDAVLRWQEFARSPARTLWDLRDADLEFYCCGDPFAARELLAFVEQALSRPAARALRAVLAEADARWDW